MAKQNLNYDFLPSSKDSAKKTKVTKQKSSSMNYEFLPSEKDVKESTSLKKQNTTKVTPVALPYQQSKSNKTNQIYLDVQKEKGIDASKIIKKAATSKPKVKQSKADKFVQGVITSALDTATFGASKRAAEKLVGKENVVKPKGAAKYIGMGLGMLAPTGLESIGSKIGSKILPKALKTVGIKVAKEAGKKAVAKEIGKTVARSAINNAVTGSLYSGGGEVASAIQGEKRSAKDIAKSLGTGAVVGGVLGGALGGLSGGIKALRKVPKTKEQILALPSAKYEKMKERGFRLNSKQNGEGVVTPYGESPKALPPTGTVAWTKEGKPIYGLTGSPRSKPQTNILPEVINMKGAPPINQVNVDSKGNPIFGLPEGTLKTINKPITYNSGRIGKLTKSYIFTMKEAERLGLDIKNDLPKIKEIFKTFAPKKGDYFEKAAKEYANFQTRGKIKFEKGQLQSAKNRGLEQNRWREVVGVPPLNKTYEKIINADNLTAPNQVFVQAKNVSGAKSKFRGLLNKKEREALAKQELQNQPPQQQTSFYTDSMLKTDTIKGIGKRQSQENVPIMQQKETTNVPLNQGIIEQQRRFSRDLMQEQPTNNEFGANPEQNRYQDVVPMDTKVKTTNLSALDNVISKVQDKFKPLQMLRKVGNTSGKFGRDVYTAAVNSLRANNVANQMVIRNMLNRNGEVVGKSFKEVLGKMNESKMRDFGIYLLQKHAMTRFARGETTFKGWLPKEGKAIILSLEKKYPEFAKKSEEWNAYNQQLNDYLVESGLLTREAADNFIQNNPDWVSNKRLIEEINRTNFQNAKKGFSGQKAPVGLSYSQKGSTRPIYDPIEMQINRIFASVNAAEKNNVIQTLYKELLDNPKAYADIAEIVPIEQNAKKSMMKEINTILAEQGPDGLNEHILDMFNKTNNNAGGEKIVKGFVDGMPVEIKIHDSAVLDALKGLNEAPSTRLMKVLSTPSKALKAVTTTYNPTFTMLVSFPRDIAGGYIASGYKNPIKYMTELTSAIVDILGNRKDYKTFKNMGAGMSGLVGSSTDLVAHAKHEIIGKGTLKSIFVNAIDKVEGISTALEQAPRLTEFKRVMKSANDFQTNLEKQAEAIFKANDITVNFGLNGKYGKNIEALFPYWRASVSGLEKTFRTYKENPKEAIAKSVATFTIPAITLYMMNKDNPKYQQLSQTTKDNNFVIPINDGNFIKIPVPKEFSFAFKVLPERLLQQVAIDNPDAYYKLSDTFINTFLPPGANAIVSSIKERELGRLGKDSIVSPLGDVTANKSYFNSPIVPMSQINAPKSKQIAPNTTPFGKFAGKLGFSPRQADYLLKSYTGAVGQLGIPVSTGGNPFESLKNRVITNPVKSTDLLNRFYDLRKEVINNEKYNQKDLDWKKYYFVNATYDRISQKQNQRKAIMENKSLRGSEKQKQLDKLQQEIIDLAQNAINYKR